MARLGRTADRFPEKLKCQTFEWKTDLCRHHVDQPPPLMIHFPPDLLSHKEIEKTKYVPHIKMSHTYKTEQELSMLSTAGM